MTNELTMKRSNLVLPVSGYELDREEMCYVEGGGFSAAWVEWTINITFFVVNAALTTARGLSWLFGKKAFINLIKNHVPTAILWICTTIGLYNLGGLATRFLSGMTDAQIYRWTSIGGIVANLLDMADGNFNGLIFG